MMYKIFLFSLILFLVCSAIPYRKNLQILADPVMTDSIKQTEKDSFTTSAKRPEYTKPYLVEYKPTTQNTEASFDIQAESAVLININTNEIIYSKNPSKKMPVASLVKVMTAIITVEHSDLQDTTVISKLSSNVGENSMGLKEGEKLTNLDLLYGLILNSGNDSAYALSESVAGSTKEFVNYMNKKAGLLGAKDTLFSDPSGLNPENKLYYSTAYDLARIAQYSLENHPILREIYQTVYREIPHTQEHGLKILENQTNLLTTYPGVKGIKTGYTEESGLCLITYAENDGEKLLGVILNSTDRKGDAVKLLDYGFKTEGVEIEHNLLN